MRSYYKVSWSAVCVIYFYMCTLTWWKQGCTNTFIKKIYEYNNIYGPTVLNEN